MYNIIHHVKTAWALLQQIPKLLTVHLIFLRSARPMMVQYVAQPQRNPQASCNQLQIQRSFKPIRLPYKGLPRSDSLLTGKIPKIRMEHGKKRDQL